MHLNAGAGRRKRGKTLNKRMLQPLLQEWPWFRCSQNPVHPNLEKTEDIPCNSLDTCKIRHLYRKRTWFRCFIGAIGTNGKCAAESTPDGVWQKWLRKSPMHLNAGAGRRERGQDAGQTHVTAVTTGMATVQMLPKSSASEPGKNRTHTAQFIEHMKDTASLPKMRTVQMQPKSSASEPEKNKTHTMQFVGHMQDTASLPKTHTVQMLQRCHRY